MRICLLLSLAFVAASCGSSSNNANVSNVVNAANSNKAARMPVPVFTFETVNTFPHDPDAFTQGLSFYNGVLYESTGQEGDSTLRKVNLQTGKIIQKYDLPDEVFAEGMTILANKIYQFSWRNRMGWVYNVDDLKLIREFRYAGEGWGMTNDGTNIFISDGTHVIRVVDPETFKTIRTIAINDDSGRPLMKLNELEYVKGEIWSNVWHSEEIGKPNHIARIDPESGKLLGWIDLQGISPDDVKRDSENTLNGIAYDAESDRIFVTGKNWKKLFEIKVKPRDGA